VRVGDVQALRYDNDRFDTVVNTMAFSGYPDGRQALSELTRVLQPGGRLIILDVNYPSDRNRIGTALVELWKRGDLIRDMHALLAEFDLVALDHEIGGFGGVHLYLATKPTAPRTQPPTWVWRPAPIRNGRERTARSPRPG
jgi:SAM-dependent methyltransferase